ncbi:MAG: DNA polymerase III subunit beta [Anaerolineae bacterium]|nr:MAG: DNA polymerase III subunit beta [Anaerolineae bacterium]
MASVDSGALLAAVQLAASARDRKARLPILARLRIFSDAGALFVAGASYDRQVLVELEAEVEGAFDVVVEPERLLALLRNVDGQVLLEPSRASLLVEADGHHLVLPSMGPQDLPAPPESQPRTEQASVPASLWRDIGALVAYAAGTDEARPALQAVCLRDYDDEGLAAMATDGYRLAEYVVPGVRLGTGDGGLLLPAAAVAAMGQAANLVRSDASVLTLCGDGDGWRRVEYSLAAPATDENAIRCVWLSSALVAARYPDARAVIPTSHNYLAYVATAELVPALKLAVAVADESRRVSLRLDKRSLAVSSSGVDGQEYDVELPAETVDGDGVLTAYFDGRYLLQAVQAINTERVALRFLDEKRPLVIAAADGNRGRHVIMPMAIR